MAPSAALVYLGIPIPLLAHIDPGKSSALAKGLSRGEDLELKTIEIEDLEVREVVQSALMLRSAYQFTEFAAARWDKITPEMRQKAVNWMLLQSGGNLTKLLFGV